MRFSLARWALACAMGLGLLPAAALAQAAKGGAPLGGNWLVVVDGLAETRLLVVASEPGGDGAAPLSARYGITAQRQTPVEAKVAEVGGRRQLTLTTQAAAVISALEGPDGSFEGTFTLKGGRVYPVSLARLSDAQLAQHRAARPAGTPGTAATAAAAASPAATAALEAPLHEVGDSWTWSVRVSPQDRCTSGMPAGAKLTHTVVGATSAGYVVEVVGPRDGARSLRAVGRNQTFTVHTGRELARTDVLGFPIREGKSWATTLAAGEVVTTLKCEAAGLQRMKLGSHELDAAAVNCRGNWNNLRSGNSDQATYKYWYSPQLRNVARWTVFTYAQGATCADIEYELESYVAAPSR